MRAWFQSGGEREERPVARLPHPLLAVVAPAVVPVIGTVLFIAAAPVAVVAPSLVPWPIAAVLGAVALAIPGASRFVALLPHRKRIALAAAVAVPLSAAAIAVTGFGAMFEHFDFMSTHGSGEVARWFVLGALRIGGPAALIVAAVEATLAGVSSFGRTGAGTVALAMHAGWYASLLLLLVAAAYTGGPERNDLVAAVAVVAALAVQAAAGAIGGVVSVGIGRAWTHLRGAGGSA